MPKTAKRARRRALAMLVLSAVVLALSSCVGQARTQRRVAGPSPAVFNRQAYRYASALSPKAEAGRYRVIVLQATDAGMVPVLRRFNPRLKVLVYQDIAYARAGDPQAQTVCTSLTRDLARDPAWFLKGLLGNRITSGADYLMDIGDAGYVQACVGHAIALAKRLGFDGVFMDGVSAALDYELPAGGVPRAVGYPTLASWQAAMYAMLVYAAGQMHAQGLSVVANIGGSTLTPGLWQRWNTPLDGAEEESWTDGGAGLGQQLPSWREKLADVAWSEAHGKYAILHSYSGTEAGNTFGLASMLLVAMGRSSYSTSNVNDNGYEAWYPEYGAARRLGAPAGPYFVRRNGVYERRFARGVVLVNPTTHAVPAFSLGGARYSGSGLKNVQAVTMGAAGGLILIAGPAGR